MCLPLVTKTRRFAPPQLSWAMSFSKNHQGKLGNETYEKNLCSPFTRPSSLEEALAAAGSLLGKGSDLPCIDVTEGGISGAIYGAGLAAFRLWGIAVEKEKVPGRSGPTSHLQPI